MNSGTGPLKRQKRAVLYSSYGQTKIPKDFLLANMGRETVCSLTLRVWL